ncbi:hypothetical protein TURU_060056 [Turdus rufiventris]|nr:hypothetical protein TURU_060056 [Turdus rufiventris]
MAKPQAHLQTVPWQTSTLATPETVIQISVEITPANGSYFINQVMMAMAWSGDNREDTGDSRPCHRSTPQGYMKANIEPFWNSEQFRAGSSAFMARLQFWYWSSKESRAMSRGFSSIAVVATVLAKSVMVRARRVVEGRGHREQCGH